MKSLLFIAITALLFSCSGTSHKKSMTNIPKQPTYDTSKQIAAFYITDTKTLQFNLGPVKRVTRNYSMQNGLDSTTHPGEYVVKFKDITDSFYLTPTIDSTIILTDSLSHPILTPTHQVQYTPSFRHPHDIPGQLVQETTKFNFPLLK